MTRTVLKLVLGYLGMLLVYALIVVAVGGGVGPVEFWILNVIVVVAAVLYTRRTLKQRTA